MEFVEVLLVSALMLIGKLAITKFMTKMALSIFRNEEVTGLEKVSWAITIAAVSTIFLQFARIVSLETMGILLMTTTFKKVLLISIEPIFIALISAIGMKKKGMVKYFIVLATTILISAIFIALL